MQAIVAASGGRLVGQAGAIQGGIEPIAGAVAGKDAAGAVAAVRGWSETADQHARPDFAEAGDGPAPVFFILEGGTFFPRYLLAPAHQARTQSTGDNALAKVPQTDSVPTS